MTDKGHSTDKTGRLEMVQLEELRESAHQMRRVEGTPELDAGIDELAASIRANGLIEPLVVRRVAVEGGPGLRWELIAGHRRLAACRRAGMTQAPCYAVGDGGLTEEAAAEMTLVENLQRRDLSAIEEAQAVERLLELHGSGADRCERVAAAVGKSVRWVYRRASICRLIPLWRDAALKHGLSAAYLERVGRLPAAVQEEVLQSVSADADALFARGGDTAVLDEEIEVSLRKLSAAPWSHLPGDPAKCGGCPDRSDAQADLFEEMAGEPRCLNRACWEKKVDEFVAMVKRQAKQAHGEIIEARSNSTHLYAEKPDERHSVPAVIIDGPKRGSVLWAPSKEAAAEIKGEPLKKKPGKKEAVKEAAARAYVRAVQACVQGAAEPDWGDGQPPIPAPTLIAFALGCGVDTLSAAPGAFGNPLLRAAAIHERLEKGADEFTLLWGAVRGLVARALAPDAPDIEKMEKIARETAALLVIPDAQIAAYVAEFAPNVKAKK